MFRAVGNRCAVNLANLNLPISINLAIEILEDRGFKIINSDILQTARHCIGHCTYKLGAKQFQAPGVFDCSSFTKWLYSRNGIWLPRRTIQQIDHGVPIPIENIQVGDLVFKTGKYRSWFRVDYKQNVGHIGIASGNGKIIHAKNASEGVVEEPLGCFLDPTKFRGVRRIIPDPKNTLTFITPEDREIETSDDFFWVIVQNLASKI